MKNNQKLLCSAIVLLLLFVLWTILICLVDVRIVGPQDSSIGFATSNVFFHNFTGVHMMLYNITDWLGLVPIGFAMGFAFLGLVQWIKRKKFLKVDYSILVLGGFYIVVMTLYIFFEMFVINYRPVLINGYLEASYPSSTTMLVMCVMPTSIIQFNARIKNNVIKRSVTLVIIIFIVFMVLGRMFSGVHWLTDIVGGAILSAGLVMMYCFVNSIERKVVPYFSF